MAAAAEAQIASLRRFNRGYTRTLGLLQPGGLYPPLSLPEARVLYEIAQGRPGDGVTASDIGKQLGLDRGYLSRLIGKLGREGLVSTTADPGDARRRRLSLTAAGQRLFADMDARSEQQAAELLAPLHPLDRRAVLDGLARAERLWARPDAVPVVLRDPLPGDLGWVVERNGAVYAAEYGWGWEIEAECAEIIAQFVRAFDPAHEKGFIAERAGERLGCTFLVREDEETARLRLVLVEAHARGLGLGSRLVREALAFARAAGYRRVVLWTHAVLTDARRVYEAAGFQLVDEHTHTRFGPEIVSQTWALTL
jgi:DNA-binding MarR family transcriptional regulator/N-acetylglutamate synthase-like GNAT family acetyltransferase